MLLGLKTQYEALRERCDSLVNAETLDQDAARALLRRLGDHESRAEQELARIKACFADIQTTSPFSRQSFAGSSLFNAFSSLLKEAERSIMAQRVLVQRSLDSIPELPLTPGPRARVLDPFNGLDDLQSAFGRLRRVVPCRDGCVASFAKPGSRSFTLVALNSRHAPLSPPLEVHGHGAFAVDEPENDLAVCVTDPPAVSNSTDPEAAFANPQNSVQLWSAEGTLKRRLDRPGERYYPVAACFMDSGRLAVSDLASETVWIFSPKGRLASSIPCRGRLVHKLGHADGRLYALCLATNNRYDRPTSDPFDSIYVLEEGRGPIPLHETSHTGGAQFRISGIAPVAGGVLVHDGSVITCINADGGKRFSLPVDDTWLSGASYMPLMSLHGIPGTESEFLAVANIKTNRGLMRFELQHHDAGPRASDARHGSCCIPCGSNGPQPPQPQATGTTR